MLGTSTTRIRRRRFFFLQVKKAKEFFFLQTSYIQGHVRGSLQVPPGLVCRQNKGDKKIKKKTKEGGLSPQEGDFKKKKTRRPRKVVCLRKKGTSEEDTRRREGGSAKERFRVSSTKKFLFLVNEYLGSERPVLFE